ncbi:hypothetical protein GALMADRAFT_208664 [Galerina marginata CBS 339.88]|uniref:Uncharacterized protein n=1 Tax=Galerina marginata (strain CBS 339.88) TaxID=685588 RepID=A0A067T7T7_GALM3|nr:hypothetical protein GALMADRAFT_208664 [Galerina marginata CBS 339.88]
MAIGVGKDKAEIARRARIWDCCARESTIFKDGFAYGVWWWYYGYGLGVARGSKGFAEPLCKGMAKSIKLKLQASRNVVHHYDKARYEHSHSASVRMLTIDRIPQRPTGYQEHIKLGDFRAEMQICFVARPIAGLLEFRTFHVLRSPPSYRAIKRKSQEIMAVMSQVLNASSLGRDG